MIKAYIREAWKAFRRNWVQFAGTILLFSLVMLSILILIFFPLFSQIDLVALENVQTEADFTAIFSNISFDSNMIGSFILGFAILLIISIGFGLGFVKMSQQALKGKTSWKVIWPTAREKFITALIAQVILIILIFSLLIPVFMAFLIHWALGGLFYVAWFLVVIHFSLVEYAIVIGNTGAVDALKKSYSIIRNNFGGFLMILITQLVISLLISMLDFVIAISPILSLFLITPVFSIVYAKFYLDNTKPVKEIKYLKIKRIKKPKRRKVKRKRKRKR